MIHEAKVVQSLIDRKITVGIMGPSRSGKDEMAEWLVEHCGLKYQGTTSTVISREVARREGITYEEAHAQRHKRKVEWRALGDEMRAHDSAALARDVLKGSNLLVGVRAPEEIAQVVEEGLCDIIYWIDRPGQPYDVTMGFGPERCHAVIQNHWGIKEYHGRIKVIAKSLGLIVQD